MSWKIYPSTKNDHGVKRYWAGKEFILIDFADRQEYYAYTYKKTGKLHIEKMKKLAKKGDGLSTHITQNRDVYESAEKVEKGKEEEYIKRNGLI